MNEVGGGKVLGTIVKYLLHSLCIDCQEIVTTCCDLQINSLKGESWENQLKGEVEVLDLAYIYKAKPALMQIRRVK
jgi:hypothetical protein